jgi:hypothetical protein
LYPFFFKRRLPLHLALASLLVGTPIFLPQLGFLGNWAGYILGPLFIGGFLYLIRQGELFRAWSRDQRVERPARSLCPYLPTYAEFLRLRTWSPAIVRLLMAFNLEAIVRKSELRTETSWTKLPP